LPDRAIGQTNHRGDDPHVEHLRILAGQAWPRAPELDVRELVGARR
jgi:hypothetical protein